MHCLKCGKETGENQVFCDGCIAVMDRYPVKRNIRVQLPNRTEPTPAKKPVLKKKEPTPEEKIAQLQKAIRVLLISLIAVILAFSLSVALLIDALSAEDTKASIGQNYSTVENDPT